MSDNGALARCHHGQIAGLCITCAAGRYVTLEREFLRMRDRAMSAEVLRDLAYGERARLVALLAACFSSSLERHPENDAAWEPGWRWVVFVDLPTGQVTWHIHDSELPLFNHVARGRGWTWDGHTDAEKYLRLQAAAVLVRAT